MCGEVDWEDPASTFGHESREPAEASNPRAAYATATLAAILTPYLTLAICAAIAIFYALPGTTTDVRPDY
jgi:hypothetical protein